MSPQDPRVKSQDPGGGLRESGNTYIPGFRLQVIVKNSTGPLGKCQIRSWVVDGRAFAINNPTSAARWLRRTQELPKLLYQTPTFDFSFDERFSVRVSRVSWVCLSRSKLVFSLEFPFGLVEPERRGKRGTVIKCGLSRNLRLPVFADS